MTSEVRFCDSYIYQDIGLQCMVKVQVNKRHTPGGGTYAPGDVRWVENMPAGDRTKSRPVVIKKEEGDSVVIYPCSTQNLSYRNRYQLQVPEAAGLDRNSYVDLAPIKLAKTRLGRRLGHLDDYDMEGLGLR